ncbi:MAG: PIN domain-containing protein [Xanthomonadaceae bacterium]|nr:PIN domain-containing protein [Xanthomonadaceae bacterium]
MIFLDANAIIYLLEGEPALQQATRRILEELRAGDSDVLIAISALSLLECRVQPMRDAEHQRLELFDQFFRDPGLEIIEIDRRVIEIATDLRARHALRTPDAIQAASALAADAKADLVTGDGDFRKVPDLRVHLVEL